MSYKNSLCYYFDKTADKNLYHVNCNACKNSKTCKDPFKKDIKPEIGYFDSGTIINESSALERKKYHDDLYGTPDEYNAQEDW